MTRLRTIIAIATVCAIASASLGAATQQRPTRSSDQQVKDLLTRIEERTDTFRTSFERALDRHPIHGSREEEHVNQSVKDFEQALDDLGDRIDDQSSGTADVEEVFNRAAEVDRFMMSHQLDASAERDWMDLRRDLDVLASIYGTTGNWTEPESMRARVDDEQVEQLLKRIEKRADQFRKSLDAALDESAMDDSHSTGCR